MLGVGTTVRKIRNVVLGFSGIFSTLRLPKQVGLRGEGKRICWTMLRVGVCRVGGQNKPWTPTVTSCCKGMVLGDGVGSQWVHV